MNPTFILTNLLVGFAMTRRIDAAIAIAVALFVIVAIHEAGHALAAWASGARPVVMITSFGGVTFLGEDSLWLGRWRRLGIAVAGSGLGLATSLVAKAAWPVPSSPSMVSLALWAIGSMGVWINLANLAPVPGLDGSAALRELTGVSGRSRIVGRAMLAAEIAVAGLGVAWALREGLTFAAVVLGILVIHAVQTLRADLKQPPEELELAAVRGDVSEVRRLLAAAERSDESLYALARFRWLAVKAMVRSGDLEEAAAISAGLSGDLRVKAERLVLLARSREEGWRAIAEEVGATSGQPIPSPPKGGSAAVPNLIGGVLARLDRIPLADEGSLLELLVAAGDLQAAHTVGEHLWERSSGGRAARLMASVAARQSRPDEARRWLRRAQAAGFRDEHLADDPDLAAVSMVTADHRPQMPHLSATSYVAVPAERPAPAVVATVPDWAAAAMAPASRRPRGIWVAAITAVLLVAAGVPLAVARPWTEPTPDTPWYASRSADNGTAHSQGFPLSTGTTGGTATVDPLSVTLASNLQDDVEASEIVVRCAEDRPPMEAPTVCTATANGVKIHYLGTLSDTGAVFDMLVHD